MGTKEKFDSFVDDHMKFDRIEKKRSQRPDLHAFLLLDELFPNPRTNIVAVSDHDQIWLNANAKDIEALTDPQILELVRCGVGFDDDVDSLYLFT